MAGDVRARAACAFFRSRLRAALIPVARTQSDFGQRSLASLQPFYARQIFYAREPKLRQGISLKMHELRLSLANRGLRSDSAIGGDDLELTSLGVRGRMGND